MIISFPFLVLSAVLLKTGRDYGAGVRAGIASIVLLLGSTWFWFSLKSEYGEPWYELALSRGPQTLFMMVFLALGLCLTIANSVACCQEADDITG